MNLFKKLFILAGLATIIGSAIASEGARPSWWQNIKNWWQERRINYLLHKSVSAQNIRNIEYRSIPEGVSPESGQANMYTAIDRYGRTIIGTSSPGQYGSQKPIPSLSTCVPDYTRDVTVGFTPSSENPRSEKGVNKLADVYKFYQQTGKLPYQYPSQYPSRKYSYGQYSFE